MPDVFDDFDQASSESREVTIAYLERRNAAPAQRAILESYLG